MRTHAQLALLITIAVGTLSIVACGGGGGSGVAQPTPPPAPTPSPQPYLPLKVGDMWTYACYRGTPAPGASTFPKTNKIIGTTTINGTVTYEYQEELPISPTTSTFQIQLLANDARGNTLLYGYMLNPTAAPMSVTPTVIVPEVPGPAGISYYDYPAEGGGTVSRVFCCSTVTNPTVFGVLRVNVYFDGSHVVASSTDGYGYTVGLGVTEEDHNFNNASTRIDCVVTATPPP
jgi:hypothetical protein